MIGTLPTDWFYKKEDVGCYLDGHMGWHNSYRVVGLAMDVGFTLTLEGDVRGMEEYWETKENCYEYISELADEATAFLQDVTEEGAYWEWDCGELMLVVEEEE